MTEPITFGTDGWRGVIAETFTYENVIRVATAAAETLPVVPGRERLVVIGWDRRFLSEGFAQSVSDCFHRAGWGTELSFKPMTTPAVSVMLQNREASWGVMITASHNPALYNGFKLKEAAGRSAPPEVTQKIEAALRPFQSSVSAVPPSVRFDFWPAYQSYLRSQLNFSVFRKSKAKVVLEHLHGAAAGIPEKLLKQTPLRFVSLHTQSDPLFGGLHPEPIDRYLGELKKTVKKEKAALGLAFDGDADRLGVVDNKGVYLPPHVVFPLLAWQKVEKLARGKIVQSISMGVLGERIAKAYGLPYEEVPVGFKHIADRMISEEVVAGGEESGGFAFKGTLPERDGILNGLLLLEILLESGKSLSDLVLSMEKRFGRVRFDRTDYELVRPVSSKSGFVEAIQNQLPSQLIGQPVRTTRTYDGIKIVLENDAWLLIRPSGTEPLLRTYAESESAQQTQALLKEGRVLAERTGLVAIQEIS